MITCNSDQIIYGLHSTIDNLASCYKCQETSKIPFIGLAIDNTPGKYDILGIHAYGLQSTSFEYKNESQMENILNCMIPDQTSLFSANNTASTLPLNCGFAVLNLTTKDGLYTDASNINANPQNQLSLSQFCAACKPGYQPNYLSATITHIVLRCNKIANC